MAESTQPEPVKAILAILWASRDSLDSAIECAEATWGSIDVPGQDHPFCETNFYQPEMGDVLSRRIVSFSPLVSPDFLVEAKHTCNRIEDLHRNQNRRTVNLDIGYLDHNKVVLASMKPAGQKIYLGRGVYADLTLRFKHGEYKPLEWTFLDLKEGQYANELLTIRSIYLRQRKETDTRR